MRPALVAMMLVVVPVAAAADPLVVHTATPPNGRGITSAQRVTLADAVAEVLASGQPEVLRASETHARVETLTPAALTCDAPDCASSLVTTLHARGVVLVALARSRNQVTLTLRWIDAQGAVRNEQRAEEIVAGWDDAIALARVSARALLAAMPAAPPMPTPTVLPPAPVPAVVARPAPPSMPATRTVVTRRPVEAIIGGALVAGGAVALTIGSIAMAQDGGDTGATVPNGTEVYVATARDTVLVIAGAAAVAGGVFLLVDGLRARRTEERLSVRTFPISGGAWVGIGGAF
jgi:hypothetical protein